MALLLVGISLANETSPQADWIAEHGVQLASIQPGDTDFTDLDFLAQYIGDARVVMLGEASHGDGAAFLAKTRLIKYLHEDLASMALAMFERMDAIPDEEPQVAQWETFKAMANKREEGMIDNLTWLADERFAGEKIIVWAASAHCLRGFSEMTYPEGREDLTNKVALGQGIYDALRDDVYAIALMGGSGSTGTVSSEPWEIDPPELGTLEAYCLDTGAEYLYLDLRSDADGFRAAFGIELAASPLGYAPMIGDWTQSMDAYLFIREMTPSLYAEE